MNPTSLEETLAIARNLEKRLAQIQETVDEAKALVEDFTERLEIMEDEVHLVADHVNFVGTMVDIFKIPARFAHTVATRVVPRAVFGTAVESDSDFETSEEDDEEDDNNEEEQVETDPNTETTESQ